MHDTSSVLLGLFLVFVGAQIGAEIAQRLRQPAVVGEIAVGCLLGTSVLGWVRPTEPLEVLAEIGAVLLLFAVGLETRLGELRQVGRTAFLVGMSGVIFPFLLATLWARSSGFPTPQALFVASAFVATSAGITARVLQELKVLGRRESRIILGAAVIDDILAMLLLGGVTALQGGKGINIGGLTLVLGQAIGFIVLIMVVGTRFMQRKSALLDRPLSPHSPLMLSLALCLGLAAASSKLGLAAIIGAFLAGTVVAESQQRHTLSKQIQPILAFLVPFFFVTTGLKVDLTQLGSGRALITVLFVTALAVIGKWVGCGLTSLMEGRRSAMIIGVGMVPRGEVGIIIASLGQQIGVFTGQVYAILIAMSLLTSVIAPPLLKWLLGNPSPEPGTEASPLFAVEETGHDSGV